MKLSATDDAYGFAYADCAAADGSDLWFTDADGNLIPHDIDTWNTSGDSYVWVKIPTLTHNTKVVMHWGEARTAAQTCTPSDTWIGYVGVWHMNKTGTTDEPDSTANGLDAAPVNESSASTSINTVTGQVGAGRSVDAQGKMLKVTGHATGISDAKVFTVGGWTGRNDRSFVGTFDEVRMYNGVLSANRIAADYATMNSPTTFLTLVSDDTPVTAAWRTATAVDGDVFNAANWACTNSAGAEVSGLPTAATDVTVAGDGLNIQIPSGSLFLCQSFTLGNCSLAADCDLCGVGTLTIPTGVTVDLKDRALVVQNLAGDGSIVSTANGTYTTLDYISTGGGQYIMTDYIPASNDVVSTSVNFTSTDCQSLWCSRESGSSKTFTCVTYGNSFRFDRNTTTDTSSRPMYPVAGVDYEVIANYGTGACKVNGKTVYTMNTTPYEPAYRLALFRLMNKASGTALTNYGTTNFKMYHFRICGADGSPKLDLVPAKNGSNVAGLWDRVSGTFYPSSNSSAAFNAGAEKGRGELVFHVPSGATATRSGVTIAASVTVSKEGDGTLNENALGYNKTKASSYDQREGTVRFTPSTSDYLDMGPTYCISGGTLTPSSSHLQIGRDRTGRFVQNGGTVDISSMNFVVGVRARGEYEMTDGELKAAYCQIAIDSGASGTMSISGGKMKVTDEIQVGARGTGQGDVLQTGGDVDTRVLCVPVAASASGTYRISGGTLVIQDKKVGYKGNGSLIQSGGSCTVNGYPWIGAEAGGNGRYEMTGGTLETKSQPLSLGRYGTGVLDVSGSAVVTASHGVCVGFTSGANNGSGTLVVTNGGTIATTSIYGGGTTAAQASVLFDNATVRTTAAGDILKDLQDVTIGAGGLTLANDFAASITNTTLKVTTGETAITMTGTGTLDLSNATVEFSSAPVGRFILAAATGDGTFASVPAVVGPGGASLGRYKAALSMDGKLIDIRRRGFMILVR